MPKAERGLNELYRDDPERADALVFGRRGLLKGTSLAAMGAAVGASIPFAARMPSGLVPAALAQAPSGGPPAKALAMPGKANLVVLQDRPLVCETPEHMLDDEVTPNDKFFIRNNGGIPDVAADPKAWKIRVDGEVNTPLDLTVGELEQRFQPVTLKLQLECGGNGRAGFQPEARGNQWGNGAIGCAEYTGVRLKDVLAAAGLKPSAVYTAHVGVDPHLSGTPGQLSLSRGVRLAKAMDEHTLIALRMNGAALPHIHGGPVRLVVPGWPGSASQKWLTRIWIRDKEHDGQGMTGTSYRVTRKPMIPGGKVDDANMAILESMPVRSIVTSVAHGAELAPGTRRLPVRGQAWAGDLAVSQAEVSVDYGATWKKAQLNAPANKYAWQRWSAEIDLPTDGYYEIWAKATDANGRAQPHVVGNWNPQGYGGNAFHRVAVLVKA